MKNNWTLRIVVFTAVCFGLAVLFGKMAGEEKLLDYWKDTATKIDGHKYESLSIKEDINVSELSEIEILSTGIEIILEKSPDNKLHLNYAGNFHYKNKQIYTKDEHQIKIDLGMLEYSNRDIKFNFNKANFGMTVKSAYAVIKIPGNITKVKINTVSGEVKITDIKLDEIQIETVSGELKIEGNIKELKSKTISGDLKFRSELPNPEVKFSTVSGDADIVFIKDPDVNVIFESTSGKIKFWGGLPVIKMDGDVKGYKLGKGAGGQLKFDTTSGDVKISQDFN